MKIKDENEVFSFCVGNPWDEKNPTSISTYTYGSTVFSGNMKEAEEVRAALSSRAGKKLNIYKLVKI